MATGLISYAYKVGSSFEVGMSEVKAISGATATEMEQLTEKAKEMGAKTKFSAAESAEAFKYMAMASWKAADMMDGIEGIMNLAAASGENLGTVSDIVTDALTAMGYSAKDSAHFADVLAAAAANSNTNVSMMGETFKYAAPMAGALGYTIEDTAQAIGIMANSGIKASQAGTSLRMILTRLASPTEKAEKYMNKYGISLTNTDGNMRPLIKVLDDMRANLSGLSEEEQIAAANAIAGQNAQSGFLAILNASQADWDKLRKAITNCDGAAEYMAETMMDNLPGAIEILSGALETGGLIIYEKFSKPLQHAARSMADFVDQVNAALEKNDTAGVINLIGDGIDKVNAKIAEKLPGVIEKISGVAGQVLDKLNAIAPGAVTAGAAIFDSLQQGLMDNLPKLQQFAAQVGPTLLALLIEHKADMLLLGLTILQGITEGLASNPDLISKTITDVVTQIGTFLTESAPSFIQSGLDVLTNIVQGISDNTEKVTEGLTSVITAITDWIAEPGNLSSLISSAMNIVTTLAQGLAENATNIGEGLSDIILAIVNWLAEPGNLASLLNAAVDIIASLVQGLTEHAEEIGTGIADIITAIIDWLSDPGNLLSVVAAALEITAALLKGLISPESLAKMAEAAEQLINNLISGIWNLASKVVSEIQSWWQSVIASVGPLVLNVATNFGQAVAASTPVQWLERNYGSQSGRTPNSQSSNPNPNNPYSSNYRQNTGGSVWDNIKTGISNIFSKKHASGIDYVPYDNYLAALHRGEAVVPKNEAERERSAVLDPAAIASAVADAVVSALSGMAVQMDGQQVGELVAPAVSAAIGASANRQKRYSGVFA